MPELGEVAHTVALLRKCVLGKSIKHVTAQPDELLFVKPLTNTVFKSTLVGHKVTNVARNGKYFMLEVEEAQTFVMHFGMTGWIRAKNMETIIMMEGGGAAKQKQKLEELNATGGDSKSALWEHTEWPPKFTKFQLTTEDDIELAFSDPRRLGRVRLFDVPLSQVDEFEPLSKLGIDFSQSQPPAAEIVPLILKRRVPIKSLLLDQTLFSGVGNWMADEVLYLSRIHPEQYANSLGTKRASELYEKLLEVCHIAAETEGNTAYFPKNWLMLHRWGKSRSKKEEQKTANGHVVSFVKVGGRTSCFVPDLQKKFRPVEDDFTDLKSEDIDAKEVKEEPLPNKRRRK